MSKKQTYNQAIEEIEIIIRKIENNEFTIDELAEKVK
jgi:exonuclease VII small subunit